MNIGKAVAIFQSINHTDWTDYERLEAIDKVLGMATHYGITKDQILEAFRWVQNHLVWTLRMLK